MFSDGHIAATAAALAAGAIVYLLFSGRQKRLVRWAAPTVTVLEAVKIAFNIMHGYTWPDAWLPLSFCAIFIPALWMEALGVCRRTAESFLAFGCPLAGLMFLIFPATSLADYPLFHFLSLYSLLYHTLMLYIGLLYLRSGAVPLTRLCYLRYAFAVLCAQCTAAALNILTDSNLMQLARPYKLPFDVLEAFAAAAPSLYTVFAAAAYLALPFAFSVFLYPDRKQLHIFRVGFMRKKTAKAESIVL